MADYGVAGARVYLEGTPRSTLTDQRGAFRLGDVPPGVVVIRVEAPDYAPARITLGPKAGTAPLLVAMVWRGEVVSATVAAQAGAPTASATRLSARDLTAAPRRNAEEVLRQVPGLTLVQHGSEGKGHQFFLRGFDAVHGADLEITVDGLPLNEWSNVHAQGYLDLGLIIPELIEAVEVTKGPFTLGQGAFGMAGSADYHLGAAPADRGWRLAYTAGTTHRHRLFAGYAPTAGGGHDFVGVEATHDDGFGQNRRLRRATVNARVTLAKLGQATVSLTALAGVSAFALPGIVRNDDVAAGRIAFDGAYDRRAEGASRRGLLALDYAWAQAGHRVLLTGYGGYRALDLLENFTGFLLNPEHGDRRDQRQETRSFGLHGRHTSPLTDTLALQTGFGLRGDGFSQREDSVGRDLERLATRRHLDGLQLITHARGGLRWRPIDSVRIDAGSRLDVIHVRITDRLQADAPGDDTLFVASPRLTARWRPASRWGLFVAYGRGFRPPEARAFSSFDPGPAGIGDDVFTGGAPTATVSDALELGTRWAPMSWVGVSLAGFATFIERESVFDHVSGVNLDLNGTRRLGAELVVDTDPLSWLSVGADLTVVDARFSASGQRVPLAPRLVSGIRAVATHSSGLRGGLRVLTVAPRPLPHGATGATLVMTDATLGYHGARVRLDLEVENVLNRRLREGEYHFASHWRADAPASALPTLQTSAGPPLNARLTLGVQF